MYFGQTLIGWVKVIVPFPLSMEAIFWEVEAYARINPPTT